MTAHRPISRRRVLGLLGLGALGVLATACAAAAPTATPAAASKPTTAPTAAPAAAASPAAGATFPAVLYTKWFNEYQQLVDVEVNYQSIGSGGGIKSISDGTVDFGATDGPMTDQQLEGARGGNIYHIPAALGAVVATYNLPGFPTALKLTPEASPPSSLARSSRGTTRRSPPTTLASPCPPRRSSSSTAPMVPGPPTSSWTTCPR